MAEVREWAAARNMKNLIDNIKFKQYFCSLNGNIPEKTSQKRVNIYVKIADSCNAHCPFCIYANKKSDFKFDYHKFFNIIDYLKSNNVFINKISFTGGEPTINIFPLSICLDYLNNHPKIFVVVNSNGYDLDYLLEQPRVNNVSLSRHAITDNDNYSIFRTSSVPSANKIKTSKNKQKIHLTCNLIKGIIDSQTEIVNYLEHCAEIGISDVGFVSLMKTNKFATEHCVDFEDVIQETEDLIVAKTWKCEDKCKCKNYVYLPQIEKKLVYFYSRYRLKENVDTDGLLVYDGEYLRTNFNSNILY